MIVLDEYLAIRVLGGDWPADLPDDDELGLPASRHWRLLQRVHAHVGRLLARAASDLGVAVHVVI